MDTKRTYQGKWWLPDKDDLCISGTLEIAQGDKALLDLHGSFYGDSGFHDECPELIHGLSLDGNKISLYKCLYQSSEHTIGGTRYQYIACYVIIGKYLKGFSELKEKGVKKKGKKGSSLDFSSYWQWMGVIIFDIEKLQIRQWDV